MYNNGSTGLVVGGSTLAVTGVSTLQVIGFAMLGLAMAVGGLLLFRSSRLRKQDQIA